jgi:hypothetical protein
LVRAWPLPHPHAAITRATAIVRRMRTACVTAATAA